MKCPFNENTEKDGTSSSHLFFLYIGPINKMTMSLCQYKAREICHIFSVIYLYLLTKNTNDTKHNTQYYSKPDVKMLVKISFKSQKYDALCVFLCLIRITDIDTKHNT